MSYSQVETNFLAKCAAVSGVAGTYNPEPQVIDTLPAVSLYFVGLPAVPDSTGGYFLVTYQWQVGVTVALEDIADAQTKLKTILPGIMGVCRADPSLSGACQWSLMEDRLEPPFQVKDLNGFRKNLYLTAEILET